MIRVVTGPPCAGKSTYVAENSSPGEVIVDYDKIATALGSSTSHSAEGAVKEAAFQARQSVVDYVARNPDVDAWVIHTTPSDEQRDSYQQNGAEFHELNPGMEECLRRAREDERPDRTEGAIHEWFEQRGQSVRLKNGQLMQVKNVEVGGVKAGPDDGMEEGEFLVYPSTFTRQPDAYGDVIAKGAFTNTINSWKASGNTMPGLYGHRFDDPDYYVAGAEDMGEDDHGWWVKGKFDMESPKGKQVYRLVKGRRLNQLSFAFDIQDEAQVEFADGTKANEIRDVKAYEFSFVPVGANQDTSVVSVKDQTDLIKSDIKAGRSISSANLDRLRDAKSALDDVIQSAEDSSDSEEDSDNSRTDVSDSQSKEYDSTEESDENSSELDSDFAGSEAKSDVPSEGPANRPSTVKLARLREIEIG